VSPICSFNCLSCEDCSRALLVSSVPKKVIWPHRVSGDLVDKAIFQKYEMMRPGSVGLKLSIVSRAVGELSRLLAETKADNRRHKYPLLTSTALRVNKLRYVTLQMSELL